ncbi:MAG: Ig-like domain-containing protein [Polyangiaceae bacterium]
MQRSLVVPIITVSALLLVGLSACGSGGAGKTDDPMAAGGTPEAGGVDGTAGDAGEPATSSGGKGGIDLDTNNQSDGGAADAGNVTQLALEVTLDKTKLALSGKSVLVAAHAKYEDGTIPNAVLWSVSNTHLGSIDDDGVFEANGFTAGSVTITAEAGSVSASAKLSTTVEIAQNPDDIAEDERTALTQGGTGGAHGAGPDDSFRFLYPYDNTVFPQGLAAPSLQFDSAPPNATYLKITTSGFSYSAFALGSVPTRITIPDAVWRGLTLSPGAAATVKVEVSKLTNGVATGPVTQHWSIAQGNLKGVIYYNTYRSVLAQNGGVMRIRPGKTAEVLQSGCTVCHSVSSQGNVLVAGVNWDQNPIDSEAFDLNADGSTKVRRIVNDGRVFSLGALTPDGARLLASGIAPTAPTPRGMSGSFPSQFYDTKSGKLIPAPTFTSKVTYALTPTFSPDGAHLAFNNRDLSEGHTLSVMDYDGGVQFSKLRTVLTSPTRVAAWPSFLPDSGGIVFHEGDSFDTAKYQGGALYADLRLTQLDKDSAPNTLAQLNGHDQNGVYYLPYGADEEAHLDYEPSVLPVPVGGYYWVLFTSRRAYGNTIAPGGSVPRGNDKWGKPQGNEVESPSPRKKIWLAPIDLDYPGKIDPSHPAIYLPGQELESGNMRAFAAFEPCRDNGGGCESAAECCDGFCRQTGHDENGPVLQCVPPPKNACSNEDETCAVATDCCNTHYLCINKRCASPTPELPPVQ